jgi:competence protein ComEC
VLLAGSQPNRLLLPGDLERRGETGLLATTDRLCAEALVVAHHGSRGGTQGRFIDRVKPRLAIASAGFRNRFGHPHPELMARLAERDVPLLRTDLDGALLLQAGRSGWEARGFRRRARPERLTGTATGPE